MAASGFSPADPVAIAAAFEAAEAESESCVDDPAQSCGEETNWTETGLIDESTGKPVPDMPYKIYDQDTKEVVASGTLDENGLSPRHAIPLKHTNLFVMYGTDDAIDEAMAEMERLQKEKALAANAKSDWRGIPAGLDEDEFAAAYDQKTIDNGGRFEKPNVSLLEGAGYGAIMVYDLVFSGFDHDHMIKELYEADRARSFDEYQLVTGAREATKWESFGGGTGQGVSFGFGEEFMAWFESSITGRDYDVAVAERRQLLKAEELSNSGYYLGGEITGGVATILIPVGGAAAAGAKGATTGARVIGGMKSAAKTGAALGAVSGAGHDEGDVIDRLDGAALGAATGGISGALLGGTGVLLARGASKMRIWARFRRGRALAKETADPARRAMGPASKSHPKELAQMKAELEAAGVKVREGSGRGDMAYSPGRPGKPGELIMDPDASYAAWRHEYQHFLDDQASGWRGWEALSDKNTRWAWEQRAYAEEMKVVRRAGLLDTVEEIATLRTQEWNRIFRGK